MLVRTDSGGGTHGFLDYCHRRRLQYSIGFTLTDDIVTAMDTHLKVSDWTPAYDADSQVRDGAWVVEVTGITSLSGWPAGMRLIVRKDTNSTRGQLPDLELRHRQRARCEDRIRNAKDTGLRNLPFHGFDANRIWLGLVALAMDLTAWCRTLALHDHRARRSWNPAASPLRGPSALPRPGILRSNRQSETRQTDTSARRKIEVCGDGGGSGPTESHTFGRKQWEFMRIVEENRFAKDPGIGHYWL